MGKNYVAKAWRHLFRNKLHTGINLGGLFIGFTIGLGVLMLVYDQLTYDDFHVHRKQLYQAYQFFNRPEGEDIQNHFGYPAGPAFKAGAPAIDKMTRLLDGGNHVVYNNKDLDIPVTLADEDFFSMFSFPIVKGNTVNPLEKLTDIVLTEDAAKRIFGNEEPVGKRIKASVGDKLQEFTVSAVLKNITGSSIRFDVMVRTENISNYASGMKSWDNTSHVVYVQLKDGATQRQAEQQLREVDKKYVPGWYDDLVKKGAKPDKYGDVFATRLLPMSEVHFSTRVNGHKGSSYTLIYTLLAIGLLIILIASFNFININLATSFTRSREIGIRKCLGAARIKLFAQLWGESFLVCFLAYALALTFVNTFVHSIDGIDKLNIPFSEILLRPDFLLLSLALLLFVSLVAGGYPSWVMTGVRTVESLKGKLSLKRKNILRSSLIVMQFVIACIMINCTFIIYQQFVHLQNADPGIKKDYVISVPLHDPATGKATVERLRGLLAADPHILSVTGSDINMGRGMDRRSSKTGIGFDYKGRTVNTTVAGVEYDYLKTFGVRLLAGRDFDRSFSTDTANNVVISESMAQQLNEKDIVGKIIKADSGEVTWRIVGVFPDFHLYSMAEKIEPLTLFLNKSPRINYCFIKIAPVGAAATMETIKKDMAALEPGQDFRGSFVDENIKNWYQGERMQSVFFSIAAAVAIVLSCTGLLAMVLLIVQQRVKEIGIRKVLGASVQSISILVSKEFLFLVLLAVLISTPLSWLAMSNWLQSFAYRIELRWWMFVLVALAAFLLALLTISFNTIRAARQNPVKSLKTD